MTHLKINIVILISWVIFLISLTQDCVNYQYFGSIHYPSYLAFLLGWTYFDGFRWEGFVWVANLLYFLGIVLMIKRNYKAVFAFIISSFLAISFMFFDNITITKSGRIAPIIELESGYFLWLISILFLTFSSLYLKVNAEKQCVV